MQRRGGQEPENANRSIFVTGSQNKNKQKELLNLCCMQKLKTQGHNMRKS